MTDVNKLTLGEVTFLSKYYHNKKDSRGSAIFRLAVNIDILLSAILAPNYWKYQNEIHDSDRILLFMGNFFDMDPYQKLLEIYDAETDSRLFIDGPKSMNEALREMLLFSDYLCRFNEDLKPNASFGAIEEILLRTIKGGKRIIKNPQIFKLLQVPPVDFSQTKIIKSDSTFKGRCIICNGEYNDGSGLLSHIFTQHTSFGDEKNPIDVGELFKFLLKIATSHQLEGMICQNYSELCIFALRRFKRLKLSEINDEEIQDAVREIIESEDFYSKGFRMPGAGFSNLRKQ